MDREPMEKRIFVWYKWWLRIVPIVLMLCHWWLTWRFHGNGGEIVFVAIGNTACVKSLYVMAYVFPFVGMLPASYFYRLGWVWRIPFGYLAGVLVTRVAYGSWVITNEMEPMDKLLTISAACAYAYWLVRTCPKDGVR